MNIIIILVWTVYFHIDYIRTVIAFPIFYIILNAKTMIIFFYFFKFQLEVYVFKYKLSIKLSKKLSILFLLIIIN